MVWTPPTFDERWWDSSGWVSNSPIRRTERSWSALRHAPRHSATGYRLAVVHPSEPLGDVIILRDHIESYEQLELLLLLRSEPDMSWTEETLGEGAPPSMFMLFGSPTVRNV